jgi:flagellar protein FliO/FliZ
MSQAWFGILFFVLVLAMIPVGLKWIQRRITGVTDGSATSPKIVSALAVGPHQRVVTIEVGPEEGRVWLTLGVTQQSVTCLHTAAVPKTEAATIGASPQSLTASEL